MYFCKLSSRAQLKAHLLSDNYILKLLLEVRPFLNINSHCLLLNSFTLYQRVNIKDTIINMDDRFNKIFLAFDLLYKEFSPRSRIIDIFANYFSLYLFIKSSNDSLKSYLLLLSNLTISSLLDSLYILIITNASIKNNTTTFIAYIYICNKDIIKMIYYAVNVLFSEAELFAIRCDIN